MNLFDYISAAGALAVVAGTVFALFKVLPEIRRIKADTSKVQIDAATAEQQADDEHWKAIVTAQTEALIAPLRTEVEHLRREVREIKVGYRAALAYIRALLSWIRQRHGEAPENLPAPPPEIVPEI